MTKRVLNLKLTCECPLCHTESMESAAVFTTVAYRAAKAKIGDIPKDKEWIIWHCKNPDCGCKLHELRANYEVRSKGKKSSSEKTSKGDDPWSKALS